MAPELVAGGGYGGLIREKPHCAVAGKFNDLSELLLLKIPRADRPDVFSVKTTM